jgi:hypothetical protein
MDSKLNLEELIKIGKEEIKKEEIYYNKLSKIILFLPILPIFITISKVNSIKIISIISIFLLFTGLLSSIMLKILALPYILIDDKDYIIKAIKKIKGIKYIDIPTLNKLLKYEDINILYNNFIKSKLKIPAQREIFELLRTEGYTGTLEECIKTAKILAI